MPNYSKRRRNAFDSIRLRHDGDSNEIDGSDVHHKKHDEPRISTLHGITIDWSDDFQNTVDSIRINRLIK
jgi:hypothetical protein